MPVTIGKKLKPFTVPNCVIEDAGPGWKGDGLMVLPTHKLEDLTVETLAELCDEFRVAVFAKAGKVDPAKGNSDDN